MDGRRVICWIKAAVAAYLAISLAVSPAWGVVINIAGFDGYADAPKLASPTASVKLFLRHSNGKVYKVVTDSRGIGKVEVPEGTIESCQAYVEGRHVATWPCNIPIGKKALQAANQGAKAQTLLETPAAVDSQPHTVVASADRDGSLFFLGYNPLLGLYFIPAQIMALAYLSLLINTWMMDRQSLVALMTATTAVFFVMIFFGQIIAETAGGGPGQGGDGGDGGSN